MASRAANHVAQPNEGTPPHPVGSTWQLPDPIPPFLFYVDMVYVDQVGEGDGAQRSGDLVYSVGRQAAPTYLTHTSVSKWLEIC